MALKTNHALGEPIKSADMNSVVTLAIQNAHNIFELFLENYFAAKVTAFLGLFFDGFSDTVKGDVTATTLSADASSGQDTLEVIDNAGFKVGQNINIFDALHLDEKIIQSIVEGFPSETNQEMTDHPQDFGVFINSLSDWGAQTFTPDKTGLLTEVRFIDRGNITSTIGVTVRIQGVDGSSKPDGSDIGSQATTFGTINAQQEDVVIFATPVPLTQGVEYAIVYQTTALGGGNFYYSSNSVSDVYLDGEGWSTSNSGGTWGKSALGGSGFIDFGFKVIMEQPDTLVLTTNLDNDYVTTDDVKRSTVNFDTGNKQIKMDVATSAGKNTHTIDLELSSAQYLSITDAAQTGLDLVGAKPTFEISFNLEQLPSVAGSTMALFYKYLPAGDQRSFLIVIGTDDKLNVHYTDSGLDGVGDRTATFTDAAIVVGGDVGNWVNITVTIDPTTADIVIYKNAVSVAHTPTFQNAFSIFNGTADFAIGSTSSGGFYLDAKVDGVRVFDGIRTQAEITADKDRQLLASEAGMVADWELNNDLLDKTANNNDLTNNNGAVFQSATLPFVADILVDSGKVYFSELQSFQTQMVDVRLWVTRNFTAQFNLAAGISGGATTLTITGDQTDKFKNGDIIDISTSDNLIRERKTLTATPSFGGGVTTLTFSATVNAFTTSAFAERVDVIPQTSIVDKDANESFSDMVYVKSVVDFGSSEVEDEYSFDAVTPNEDVTIKLDLTREDLSLVPIAKRLGVSLND